MTTVLSSFHMQTQLETNWCWAAVSASINQFYQGTIPWSQCQVAAACLGLSCCQYAEPCDSQFTLEHPLAVVGHLERHAPGSLEFHQIMDAVDRDAVVCCHISWYGGGGHFVAIVGYDADNGDVLIQDPARGGETVPFATLANAFNSSGVWDYTYFASADAGGIP